MRIRWTPAAAADLEDIHCCGQVCLMFVGQDSSIAGRGPSPGAETRLDVARGDAPAFGVRQN